jgi:hypothetical protein
VDKPSPPAKAKFLTLTNFCMKKLYLFFPLFFIVLHSQAQITKGTILLGGDLGFSTYSDKTTSNGTNMGLIPSSTKFTEFSIAPSIGMAIRDNLVLGLNLGLGYSNETNNPDSKENDYSIGIFLRNYKYLGSRFYFFGETRLGFSYDDATSDDSTGYPTHEETKSCNVNLSFSPGVAYALNRKWQLEVEFPGVLSAQYIHGQTDYLYAVQSAPSNPSTQHQENSEFNFNTSLATNFNLEVGLRYVIGGK